MIRRIAAVGLLAGLAVALAAGPALGDPAEPTNFRSRINALDPAPAGVTIEVIGGDAFLSIAVAEGHSVLVPGYFSEPYLRIDPDGSVFLNDRSPARYINQDRYGLTEIPDHVDQTANPEWVQIDSGGTFAWHDHRIHWMSQFLPPTVAGDRTEIVFPWTVPVFIDGVETEVRGELLWFPSTNPAGPLLIGVMGILPFVAFRRRQIPSAWTATITGAVMLFVAVAQFGATPSFDRGFPVAALFPAIAVVAGLAALWLRGPSIRTWGAVALSAAALLWWAWSVAAALTAPVLPSQLPEAFERSAVALAGWIGLGVLIVSAIEIVRLGQTPSVPEGAPA